MLRFLKWALAIVVVALVGLGVAYWTPDTDAAAMRAKYGTAASQYVDMGNGLRIHLRDEGPRDAPVIVLIHGSNAFLQTWDEWTRRLNPDYRVIRLDLPGHGLTGDYPARAYSRGAFVDVVDRVVTRLGVSRFALAGNSMGGGVAWAYAHKHPEKLTSLVLVDATGQPEPPQSSPPLAFRIAGTPVLRGIVRYFTPRSLIEDGYRQSVSHKDVVTPAAVDRFWELLRYPGNRKATIDRFSTPRDPVVTGPVKMPLLILWGAEDRLIPVSSAQWFAAQSPGAQTIIYPGVGHLMMEEIPDRSSADLKAWLAKLPAAR